MALGDGLSLLFRMRADGSQAKAEMREVSRTVSKELRDIDNASKVASGNIGGLSGAFTSLLNPTALVAGAALAAGTAIFSLGKQALEAAGELFDLSQKTNFSVETLSALKNAGETAGVSIGSLSASLGIFQKNMVAAHDPTSKQGEAFRRLNIDINDNEKALRDAFRALNEMPEGAARTAAAMQLFGRSGKDVDAIIKETNGSLDDAINKYRQLGTLVSTETARSADELGDSITALGQGLKGMATDLVSVLAPAIRLIIGLVDVAIKAFRGWMIAIKYLFTNNLVDQVNAKHQEQQNQFLSKLSESGEVGERIANAVPGLRGQFDAFRDRQARQPVRRATLSQAAGMLGGIGQQAVLASEARMDDLSVSGAAVLPKTPKGGAGTKAKTQAERDAAIELTAALREAREAERENQRAFKEAIREYEADRKEMERAAVDHQRALTAIADVYGKARIAQLRDDAEEGKLTYLEAEKAILKIEADAFTRRAEQLQKSIGAEQAGTVEYQRLTDEYGRLQAEAAGFKEEAERRKRDALRQTIALEDIATTKAEMRARGGGEQTDVPGGGFDLTGVIKEEDYSKPKAPDFTVWKEAVSDVKEMTVDSFKQMGEAMGSAIEAWVLYGSEGGQSIKKVMATILAALSAEAAVKAIFQLAEGFAKLAGWMPGPAALHFKAAALYGAVAVGAGVAGRALAGNSFSQGGAGAGGSSGSNGGGNAQQAKPTPVDVNRRAGETVIRVDIRRDSGSIVDAWVEDFQGNGRSRQVVSGDGQLATV